MKHLTMTVLLATVCAGAVAQEVGRLFTSPAERAALERGRTGGLGAAAEKNTEAAPEKPALEGEHILVLTGIVRRSGSGRPTTFIDAEARPANSKLRGGARLGMDRKGGVILTLSSGKRVLLKPGQRVDAVSGKVLEAYDQGTPPPPIRIKP